MKQRLLLLLTLFLTACAVAETGTAVPLTITPGVTLSPYSTASTPLAQVTATTEPTDIPPIPAVTTAPTDTPQPTPTPIPPPTGRIYFMWDPLSDPDDLPNPVHNLYVAIPGDGPGDWHIETVLTELVGIPVVALSPDKTKLAFTALEDANNDGSVSLEGASRYFDAPNIFVYSLMDNSLRRITDNFPRTYHLAWSHDSQRLVYQNSTDVYITNLFSGEEELLSAFPDYVQELAWAPDGRYLLIRIYGGEIYLYDNITGTVISLDIEKQGSNLSWSPDSQWLASNELGPRGLFLIATPTTEVISLVPYPAFSYFAWSHNRRYLAFTNETRFEGSIFARTSFWLWDVERKETIHLAETGRIFNIIWSSDSQTITIGVLHEDRGELTRFDLLNNQSSLLLTVPGIIELRPLAWSPDEEWLLFYNKDSNRKSTLNLIHKSGGEIYRLLDTTDTFMPYSFFWLTN